jgi:hypothetical protein
MYYPDLAPCEYFQGHPTLGGATLLAIGWLEPGHPYTTGEPDLRLVETMQRLFRSHGQGFFAGSHLCGFCLEAAGGLKAPPEALRNVPSGSKELFLVLPDRAALLAAPELISHYIALHRYQPPEELRTALAWRPPIEF